VATPGIATCARCVAGDMHASRVLRRVDFRKFSGFVFMADPAELQAPSPAAVAGSAPCSAATLGRLVGITEQAVTDYARRHIMVRVAHGQFDWVRSVQNYCAHMRDLAAGKGGGEAVARESALARKRLAEALAAKAELANAANAGRLVEAAAVETEWGGVRTVRAGMLALPSRVGARLPHLTAHDIGEIEAEVRAALTEIGTGEAPTAPL
jgi:terminase small subunit / prophage DNA-packing protein